MSKAETLGLANNSLGSGGVVALTALELPALRSLGLRQTGLDEAGIKALVGWCWTCRRTSWGRVRWRAQESEVGGARGQAVKP